MHPIGATNKTILLVCCYYTGGPDLFGWTMCIFSFEDRALARGNPLLVSAAAGAAPLYIPAWYTAAATCYLQYTVATFVWRLLLVVRVRKLRKLGKANVNLSLIVIWMSMRNEGLGEYWWWSCELRLKMSNTGSPVGPLPACCFCLHSCQILYR